MSETPLTPSQIQAQESKALSEGYVHRVLVALDQFANVLLGGNPDETMSARSARAAARGNWFGKFMVRWLDFLQSNHGEKAEAGDLARSERVEQIEAQSLGVQVGKLSNPQSPANQDSVAR